MYTCSYCGKAFNQMQSLKNHENSKHRNKLYICEKCPYKGHNIYDHNRRKHGEKMHSCTSCDYQSYTSRNLHCHTINKHSISREKEKSGSKINRLATKLYSDDGVKYKCKKCPYTTEGPSSIYKHEYTHTKEKKNYH